ncbi:alpha/beta hydrolase [Metabacillus niabensis]|uniref:alpha/beta hydrolase n=1 Tax=Metabacillus niabensis TaxID=324854 RepID=UPI001CFA14F9|nr:acetylxylan esterase [Metabacillus niabensis]
MFEYERSLPLGFKELSIIRKDGYTVRDLSYLSPLSGNVPAYLVVPNKEGKSFPAAVFLHPGQGDRTTFLSEAVDLASKGVISLLIDAPSMRKTPPQSLSQEHKLNLMVEEVVNIQGYIQTVVDLQRGIDLLSSLENVDSNRLAYVGHSLGATWGGVLAGVENRIKAYVLMAGLSNVSTWHKSSEHPLAELIRNKLTREQFNKFISEIELLDAVHYIKKAAPASLFFQFSRNDEFISKDQAHTFYDVASSPKEVAWYETDHLFKECHTAYKERMQWILRQLELHTK